MRRFLLIAIVAWTPATSWGQSEPERVRRVVVHVRTLAEANARKSGDPLADAYIRGLAEFCVKEKVPTKEFLLALGVGLDKSDFLRRHPLTKLTYKNFGSDDERDRRKAVLGEPTLRRRGDWLLHFALSASLTAAVNADTAEQIGIAKEWQDSLGASGFSFADLAADDAGIAFAAHLLADPKRLSEIAKSFRGDDFLPPLGDLEENLPYKTVVTKYGEADSDTFRAACRRIRERMNEQAVYKKWNAEK